MNAIEPRFYQTSAGNAMLKAGPSEFIIASPEAVAEVIP